MEKEKKETPKLTMDMTEEEIYALHHVNEDRLEAMKEYTNARFQGVAIAMFLMSCVLLAASVYLHGFTDGMSLFMLAGLGIQGALLEDSGKKRSLMDWLCHLLYVLPFPAMLVVFMLRETENAYYDTCLMWFVVGGIVIISIGVLPHFLRNPYRSMHHDIRLANRDIRRMEKAREKAKIRQDKEEERERRRLAKEAEKIAAKQEKEAAKKEAEENRQEAVAKMKEKTGEMSEGVKSGFSVVKGKITSFMSKRTEEASVAEAEPFQETIDTDVTKASEESDDHQVG